MKLTSIKDMISCGLFENISVFVELGAALNADAAGFKSTNIFTEHDTIHIFNLRNLMALSQ